MTGSFLGLVALAMRRRGRRPRLIFGNGSQSKMRAASSTATRTSWVAQTYRYCGERAHAFCRHGAWSTATPSSPSASGSASASGGPAPPATAGSRITVVDSVPGRVEAVEQADVRAVDEDVQELRQLVARRRSAHAAPDRSRRGSRAASRTVAPAQLDLAVAAGLGSQDRGDADRRHRAANPTQPPRLLSPVRAGARRSGRSSPAPGRASARRRRARS